MKHTPEKICPCKKSEVCLLHNASMRLEKIEDKIIMATGLISDGFVELKEWAKMVQQFSGPPPDEREE